MSASVARIVDHATPRDHLESATDARGARAAWSLFTQGWNRDALWDRVTLDLGLFCFGSAQVAAWLSPTHSVVTTQPLELIGACLVAVPTFRDALFPSEQAADDVHSNRLVSLAILASLGAGETWAAFATPLIMRLGHWLESRGLVGVEDARESLRRLTVGEVAVLDEETGRVVTAAIVQPGQLMVIPPHESFVADGVVESGSSTVDESTLTGESFPREVGRGDAVLAGTTNGAGVLRVRATATGESTLAGRVARDFDAAVACKPAVTKTLERYARWYVPGVVAAAILTFLVTGSLSRGTALLLVCCPCALALAGPAAWIATVSVALRRGILIRANGNWEHLADVDSLALDKTGTITTGQLSVVAYRSFATGTQRSNDGSAHVENAETLEIAHALALASTHPAAMAIARYANERIRRQREATDARELAGHGITGHVQGKHALLGRISWLEKQGVVVAPSIDHAGPVVGLAVEGCLLATFFLEDAVRSEAKAVIDDVRRQGVSRVVMITGDRVESARHAAAALALDDIHADCTPQSKRDLVLSERSRRGRVAMVGDGVNDALALAASDVGIAISRPGGNVARGAADVILWDGDLKALPGAIRLARSLRRLVTVNMSLALGCMGVMVVGASLGATSPLAAAVLHNVGAVAILIHCGLFVGCELRRRDFSANSSGRAPVRSLVS